MTTDYGLPSVGSGLSGYEDLLVYETPLHDPERGVFDALILTQGDQTIYLDRAQGRELASTILRECEQAEQRHANQVVQP